MVDVDVRNNRRLPRIVDGQQRREQVRPAAVVVGPVSMISLLVYVVGAHCPICAERMFDSSGGMDGIGRFVLGIDVVRRSSRRASRDTAGILRAVWILH